MKKGDPILYFEKNGQIVSAWHNNKQVTVLSTMHDASETQKQLRSRHDPTGHRNVTKPVMVDDYNAHLGGVDKAGQYFQYYRYPHRSAKWWKQIFFFHLLDVCVINAYVVYKDCNPRLKMDNLDFRLRIIDGLLTGWPVNQSRRGRRSNHPDTRPAHRPDSHSWSGTGMSRQHGLQ